MKPSLLVEILAAHCAVLGRLLPSDELDGLAVRQGQFTNVVIGSDRVVCFPRTPAAAGRLSARASGLRTLAALNLDVRIPEPLLEGTAPDADGLTFLVLSRIPGAPLPADVVRDSKVAEAVATQYAALLAVLARAGTDEAVRAALPPAPGGRWRQFAIDVRTELLPLMSDDGRQRAERVLAAVEGLPRRTGAVVHGDLGAANVLWVEADGLPQISGVIDWDGVEFGDPAEDLAAVSACYGENLLRRILEIGDWADSEIADRIVAIRSTFALQQALSALRDGDDAELKDGLADYVPQAREHS